MKVILIALLVTLGSLGWSQGKTLADLSNVAKGEYVILEVRMQLEDEFQTVEGNEAASLSRIALFTGKNQKKEVLSKGFRGYNEIVLFLNHMRSEGFILDETYSIKGNSLIITHYIFQRKKK